MAPLQKPILIAGATGYVGGRLVPRLLEKGYKVRVMGRSLAKLSSREWANHPNIQIIKADVLELDSLYQACKGCGKAYYLVHSMSKGVKDFAATDRKAALNMTAAAEKANLDRIIYLGGIIPKDPHISHHLKSRAQVGFILCSGKVPVTWLRAAMILGSGSASFELLRYLADRLPVMITPRWVHTPCQPIGIRNVLGYLVGCLEHPKVKGKSFEIGGTQVTTYGELFQLYAKIAGLTKRLIIPVPVLSPKLSSYWINLVTPVPAALARPLAEGLRNPVVVTDNSLAEIIPQDLFSPQKCIEKALERIEQTRVETCWMDAGQILPPEWHYCSDAPYAGGTELTIGFRAVVACTQEMAWQAVSRLGGDHGWYHGDFLWRLRGFMDRMIGGVGMRSGRRHPTEIAIGDALDFWRVLDVNKPLRLLLLAEMKNPGEAVFEIHCESRGPKAAEIQLVARFLPRGLVGILYWYSLYHIHGWLYGGMLKKLAQSLKAPLLVKPHFFDPAKDQPCHVPSHIKET